MEQFRAYLYYSENKFICKGDMKIVKNVIIASLNGRNFPVCLQKMAG